MILIILSFIFLFVFFFWSTIYTVVNTFYNKLNPSLDSGTKWFVGLGVINIAILIFISYFYYLKINEKGKIGIEGERGYPGLEGSKCIVSGC